jgi:hypothetical protein
MTMRRRSGPARWHAPVVDDGLEVLLQHEGGTGSEEGSMAEDDDGWRWELTTRGLKRQRQWPGWTGGKGGGGALGVLLARKKGREEKNFGRW